MFRIPQRFIFISAFVHLFLAALLFFVSDLKQIRKEKFIQPQIYFEVEQTPTLSPKPPKIKLTPFKKPSLKLFPQATGAQSKSTVIPLSQNESFLPQVSEPIKSSRITLPVTVNKNLLSQTNENILKKPKLTSPQSLESEAVRQETLKPIILDKTAFEEKEIDFEPRVNENVQKKSVWKEEFNEEQEYQKTLQLLIKANWSIPEHLPFDEFILEIKVSIKPSGELAEQKFIKQTNFAPLNSSVSQAIIKAAPFPKHPASFPENKNFNLIFRFSPQDVQW